MVKKLAALAFCLVFVLVTSATAQNKKKDKPIKVSDPSLIYTVTLANGKNLQCFVNKKGKALNGKARTRKGKTTFTPTLKKDKAKTKVLKIKIKEASNAKKRKKAKKRLAKFRATVKGNKEACANPGGGGGGGTPPTDPAFCESLDEYDGAFGAAEATYLLEKFGFGVGEKEEALVASAASTGIAGFVTDVTSAVAEDQGVLETVDAIADGDPVDDANDAILLHYILTNNPVHLRTTESLHGLITTARDVLSNDQQELWYDHWKLLRNSALTNKTYIETVQESAIHPMMLLFLDGASNIAANPNENYGRELQELFTTGADCPGGTANYTESRPNGDVLNASRIMTGWKVEQNGSTWEAKFVNGQHEQVPQAMYAGTPHAFSSNNFADLIQNMLERHPCAGDFYAQELLKDFLTEDPPIGLVRNFGAVIRANQFRIMDSVAALMKSKAAQCGTFQNATTKKPDRLLAEIVRVMKLRNAIELDPDGNLGDLTQGVEASGYQVDLPKDGVFYQTTGSFRTPPAQLELLNSLGRLIDIAKDVGPQIFDPQDILPTGDAAAESVVDFVAARLNVTLSVAQKTTLVNYLNRSYGENGSFTPDFYDNTDPSDRRDKGLTLYMIMSVLPGVSLG